LGVDVEHMARPHFRIACSSRYCQGPDSSLQHSIVVMLGNVGQVLPLSSAQRKGWLRTTKKELGYGRLKRSWATYLAMEANNASALESTFHRPFPPTSLRYGGIVRRASPRLHDCSQDTSQPWNLHSCRIKVATFQWQYRVCIIQGKYKYKVINLTENPSVSTTMGRNGYSKYGSRRPTRLSQAPMPET